MRNTGFGRIDRGFRQVCLMMTLAGLAAAATAAAPSVPAAVAPVAAPASATPPTLGRLFFTPEERVALDRQRLTGLAEAGNLLTLNGVTRNRANGRSTVWLNGLPWHEAGKFTGVTPSTRDAAGVVVETGKGQPLSLRVGESANRISGEKNNKLAGGRIVVHEAVSGKR